MVESAVTQMPETSSSILDENCFVSILAFSCVGTPIAAKSAASNLASLDVPGLSFRKANSCTAKLCR